MKFLSLLVAMCVSIIHAADQRHTTHVRFTVVDEHKFRVEKTTSIVKTFSLLLDLDKPMWPWLENIAKSKNISIASVGLFKQGEDIGYYMLEDQSEYDPFSAWITDSRFYVDVTTFPKKYEIRKMD
jgi:hypothetical protein